MHTDIAPEGCCEDSVATSDINFKGVLVQGSSLLLIEIKKPTGWCYLEKCLHRTFGIAVVRSLPSGKQTEVPGLFFGWGLR